MKKSIVLTLSLFLLLPFVIYGQSTYSWEDGGTILGYYGNLSDPQNVGSTNGVNPYDGSAMLSVSEAPLSGTPQAFVAWVTDLSAGDEVTACFYGYDDTPGSSPSLRIWGSWSANDDIDSYQGSADGNTDYTDGSGWSQVCHTFSTSQENWSSGEALVVQARLYSGSEDPTVYFIDLISVDAPETAMVNFPGAGVGGANAGDDQFVSPGDLVTLDGSASQGDIVLYLWQQTAGTSVSLSGAETSIATFTAPEEVGALTFDLTVYYDSGEFDTDDVSVNVVSEMTIAEARSAGVGIGTIIEGVVISPNFQSGNSEYTIQDETAGLVVFGPGFDMGVNYGDLVRVSGVTDEYNGKFELVISSVDNVENFGPGAIPDVQVITVAQLSSNGEEYESELIMIEDVTVVSGEWPAEGDFANLTIVDDGATTATMRIDNDTDIDGSPEPVWPANVTGVGSQYDYDPPYDEFYQLIPRFVSDFQATDGNQIPHADAGEDQAVDQGVLVTLDGSNSSDADGTIVGYIWEQVEGTQVDLSDYEEPIITFTAPNENATLLFKLTVYDNLGAVGIDYVSVVVISGEISIFDIQYTTDAGDGTYPSPMDGADVAVVGIVTAKGFYSSGNSNRFFISDPEGGPWHGIYIFNYDAEVEIGDEVAVSGSVTEFYGFTEISFTTVTILSSDNQVPEPIAITTGELASAASAEEYEGCLVKIESAVVTQLPNSYGEWYVDDGSGECQIDNGIFDYSPTEIGEEIASIVGAVDYSYDAYAINPRNAGDIGGGTGGEVSIYDIQYTTEQGDYCYETPMTGQVVTTSGIVTHVHSVESPNFFLQDPNGDTWSGIYVFDTSVVPSIGDELEITATVNEYYSFTQLTDVTVATTISSGNTISPATVTANVIGIACSESGEMYESMLVSYSNVTFESVDEYGNWTITDGTGTAMIDDYYFDGDWPTISEGDFFESVSGVVGYSYSEFKLYPRNENDFNTGSGESSVDVDYQSGWNMVGISMNVESTVYTDVYTEAVAGTMYGFNETYTSETEFNPGDGYWLYFDSEGTQSITGQSINTLVVPLSAGWNLISGPSESVNISNAIDPDDIIVPGTLYGFNGTYVSTSDLQPGSGYWLNASSAGEVIFSTSEVAAKETNSINSLVDASLLTINGLPLYFGIDISDEDLMMFSMPPLPPSNSLNGENRFFDVRFGNDRKILSGDSQVRVTGAEDNLSLYWSIKTDEDWDLVDEFGNKTSLKGTGETILDNFSNRFLLQKRELIPETFTLCQNFPNPFNPVTSINYAIPEERFVTVSVYNVMGQKIVDLVNELNTAGYHYATWNSTDIHGYPVSSGVYIYTITAGDYHAVKKMILMK